MNQKITTETEKEATKSSMRLKVSRVSFSDYDFIRLFIAYLRKKGEIYLDRESLSYDLYSYREDYEILFQDVAVKKQIEGNYLEIQEALQQASLYGLITMHYCSPNDEKRLISIDEGQCDTIIKQYDENICSKMEELIKEYLKDKQTRKMIAEDWGEDKIEESDKTATPIRTLKKEDTQRLEHMRKMIKKDFEEDE